MPTAHVEPSSGELLQDIAESLLKARKIVVVTGAGISTNSGIPDFRSENGLYSLIQAQFDAAAKQEAPRLDTDTRHGAIEDEGVDNRPAKRLRSSLNASPQKKDNEDENIEVIESLQAPVKQEELAADPTTAPESPSLPESKPATAVSYATPRSARHPLSIPHLMTSPLSSPPPDEQLVPPSTFRFAGLPRFGVPPSSSPLSSPPPVLFDPYEPSSPDSVSNEHSNTSDSESEEFSAARKLFASSQGSSSGRSTLPNMKGRDLFDVSVWADPVRTQVFYTFATSLRQKIKDAEPTGSHRFISHLRNRGKLVRCYTQNIDQIEEKVGLSTSLIDGPGSRGRFSRRSTANRDQLAKMVDEPLSKELPSSQNSSSDNSGSESATPQTQASLPDAPSSSQTDGEASSADSKDNALPPTLKKEPSQSGVECVFLHGSLESLRCFLCGQVCSWDEENRETSTLTGQQPECPRCAGAAAAREEKGKRALGVGKLRPDIVLYGEEHPSAHLISPIITHDLALYPDMLLILGTSLRVHGLKVMVREFAKTVHSKGGKVVFVNFTKPPESSWGDIIDFWIQWDCDAWVDDLHVRVPRLWREPSPKKPRPPAANPVAMRDSKVTGAYCTLKILKELRRITGKETPEKTADRATNINMTDLPPLLPDAQTADSPSIPAVKLPRSRTKAQRKSAPGALEKPKKRPSTLNPNHGRSRKSDAAEMDVQQPQSPVSSSPIDKSSILNSVKSNPRVRKRKIIDGEEIVLPTVGRRRGTPRSKLDAGMTLPPLRPGPTSSPFGKPQPMEPISPPTGPLTSLSPNLCSSSRRLNPFYIYDPLVGLLEEPSSAACTTRPELGPSKKLQRSDKRIATAAAETDAAAALADVGTSPLLGKARASRGLEGQLRSWGSNWKCSR